MKVLVLQAELGLLRGGGENFTRNLFREFAALGHEVTAAFAAESDGSFAIGLPEGIRPLPLAGRWSMARGQALLSVIGRYLGERPGIGSAWGRVQNALAWRAFRRFRQRFARRAQRELAGRWRDFDVVYVHGNATLAGDVARHTPTLLRLPGPVSPELAPLLRAVPVVCANGDALEQMRAFLGERILELPVGLDEKAFKPGARSVRPALGWGEAELVVGYVGRLTRLKGSDLLARAFRDVAREFPHARLLLVGRGEEERALRSILAREIAGGKARIVADVPPEELPAWYRAMDLFAMPSRYENFSNALLEAMACGVPFVASDVGGNRRMAESQAGWLFQAGCSRSLSQRLSGVLPDRAAIKRRGEAGHRYTRGRYSWRASALKLESVIRSRLGVGA